MVITSTVFPVALVKPNMSTSFSARTLQTQEQSNSRQSWCTTCLTRGLDIAGFSAQGEVGRGGEGYRQTKVTLLSDRQFSSQSNDLYTRQPATSYASRATSAPARPTGPTAPVDHTHTHTYTHTQRLFQLRFTVCQSTHRWQHCRGHV